MKHIQVQYHSEFEVVLDNNHAQAAVMVLQPGQKTGGQDNTHQASDQWLYVLSGQGRALVCGSEVALAPGSLLLIERGEGHEIANTGEEPLNTLNFYTPPAY